MLEIGTFFRLGGTQAIRFTCSSSHFTFNNLKNGKKFWFPISPRKWQEFTPTQCLFSKESNNKMNEFSRVFLNLLNQEHITSQCKKVWAHLNFNRLQLSFKQQFYLKIRKSKSTTNIYKTFIFFYKRQSNASE